MPEFRMRRSRLLEIMRGGGTGITVKLNLSDPRVADLISWCGPDGLWLDMEHCPNTIEQIENQVRAATLHDVDTIVRVKRGSYSDLCHPLEMNATGIMVPHCMSADDARRVAHFTRFHPVGRRPWDSGNADGAYTLIPRETYVEQSNTERLVIVQIEDPEPMNELDEIAQVEGIDMLFFGPGDFSQGIGRPGQFDHPEVIEARDKVLAACKRHGKLAGTVGSLDTLAQRVEEGFALVNLGADVLAIRETFLTIIGNARKVLG